MIPCGKSSNMWRSTGTFCCRDANKLVKDQTHGYYPNHTNHLPLKICNKEVLFVDSFTYIGSLFTNDCSSPRYITYRIAKTASVMCRLSNPLSRKHRISKRTNINMYRTLVVSVCSMALCSTCAVKGASYVCTGSSTSATKASVNAPSNQTHHLSYDNAACAGSDISTACHPPSLYEEHLTSTQTSMVGKDQEAAPKLDVLIPRRSNGGSRCGSGRRTRQSVPCKSVVNKYYFDAVLSIAA